jgi:hypothetical protein
VNAFPSGFPQKSIIEFVARYCATLELSINKMMRVGEQRISDPGLDKKKLMLGRESEIRQ